MYLLIMPLYLYISLLWHVKALFFLSPSIVHDR